jgi:hypothetical protein
LRHCARKAQPVRAVIRRGRHDLPQQHHAGIQIVALERGISLAAQLRQRFGRLPGIGFDLRLKLDRGVGQIGALERFVRGGTWCASP